MNQSSSLVVLLNYRVNMYYLLYVRIYGYINMNLLRIKVFLVIIVIYTLHTINLLYINKYGKLQCLYWIDKFIDEKIH